LQVGGIEGAFLGGGEDGDDAAEGGGTVEEREEVEGQAEPGVVGYGKDVGQAFGGVYG
jgi:hypothetical protein